MEKFLESADPYIIQIGIGKLSRETDALKQSIRVLFSSRQHPEAKRRIGKYAKELRRRIAVLKELKVKVEKLGKPLN